MSSPRAKASRFLRDQRGAVLLEFTIALMPLLMTFFAFFQVAMLISAKMIVRHATITAARAAIVVSGGGDTNPGFMGAPQGEEADIQNAFRDALGVWGDDGALVPVSVTASDPGCAQGCNGDLEVNSVVTYRCRVPLGNQLVCGGDSMQLFDRATLPKQGANYQ